MLGMTNAAALSAVADALLRAQTEQSGLGESERTRSATGPVGFEGVRENASGRAQGLSGAGTGVSSGGSSSGGEGSNPPLKFVSKDEGMMDSGEWLEELRSGFGPPPPNQGKGKGTEVKGWGAEFEEDGRNIETGTWLDTLKADFEERTGTNVMGRSGVGIGAEGSGWSAKVEMDDEERQAAEDAARVRKAC